MQKITYEKMSTEELETLLREDFYGIKKQTLDDIMTICEVLARRMPQRSSAQDSWKRFKRDYLREF